MQTLEFIEALRKIVKELKIVELTTLLQPWVTKPDSNVNIDENIKNNFVQLLFESNSGYHRLILEANTHRILQQMSIGNLYEPVRLRSMMTAVNNVQQLSQLAQGQQIAFSMIAGLTAQLDALLKVQRTAENLLEKEKIGDVNPNEAIVELELIEYSDEQGFSPKRIQILSECIKELHSNLAILHGSESQKITFKYFDSGSGLLLGIQCAKEVAETISKMFAQWWEKIVFFRYDSFDKKVAAANKSLSFAESVEDSIVKGTITREVGDNLKYRVFQEMEKLTGIGVTAPITAATTIDQRQLLTEVRNTKLLTEGTSTSEGTPSVPA